MRHVLVETTWVVDCVSPEHARPDDALNLLASARRGEIALYVPAVCLREAADKIRFKWQTPKRHVDPLRECRRWAIKHQKLSPSDGEAVERFFALYERLAEESRDGLDARLKEIQETSGVEVFALSDEMLARVIALRATVHDVSLKPFDEAILGAVLVRVEQLRARGIVSVAFCSRDEDLAPTKRTGGRSRSETLRDLYTRAGIQFQFDFVIEP